MRKLLEVREFDRIVGNPDYSGDPGYRYLGAPGYPETAFAELLSFVEEFAATDENDDAYDCLKITRQRGPGEVVSAKNYVGLIQLRSGCQVQILPKISMGGKGDADSRATKSAFVRMLRCMDDFESKAFSPADLSVDRLNVYEIFVGMYARAVEALVKRGLKSNYIGEEGNLRAMRGKLSVQRHVTLNATHKERFFCEFDEYELNRPENRLIKSTLLKLQGISEAPENRKVIARQLAAFELVEPSNNYDADFAKCSADRSMAGYEQVLRWSRVFLKNKSFTSFSGDSSARALLFPMDRLFEAYVGKNARRSFGDWDVSLQDGGYYLFDEPQQFRLRPDIVMRKGDRTVILDTKWKSLVYNPRINYGISQGDMYQMYAYAKKYKTPEIWLLYPVNGEMRGHDDLSFESMDGEEVEAKVRLFFVDCTDIEGSLAKLAVML